MRKKNPLATLIGLGLLLLLGALSSAGTRAMGRPEEPARVMDRCARLWTSLCDRAAACGVVSGETAATCFDVGLANCCAGSACLAPESQPRATVEACEDDLGARGCAALAGPADGTLPLSCAGLL